MIFKVGLSEGRVKESGGGVNLIRVISNVIIFLELVPGQMVTLRDCGADFFVVNACLPFSISPRRYSSSTLATVSRTVAAQTSDQSAWIDWPKDDCPQ